MPGAIAFDTLAYVKKLKEAGVPEAQAEAQAETFAEIIDERLATKHGMKELEVALKRDLKELEVALKRDLKGLEVALKRDLKELEIRLKYDLTLRLGAMMMAGIAIVATLVKLL